MKRRPFRSSVLFGICLTLVTLLASTSAAADKPALLLAEKYRCAN